jgi:hypothetical protein
MVSPRCRERKPACMIGSRSAEIRSRMLKEIVFHGCNDIEKLADARGFEATLGQKLFSHRPVMGFPFKHFSF